MSNDTLMALASAYVALLALSPARRCHIQRELCALRDAIANLTGDDPEDVQNGYEQRAYQSPLREHWIGLS